jgi:phosphoglycolate phosphatase
MEKIRVKLIVFDLDGTLADSLPDLTAAANYVCRRLGLPEHPASDIREMIGGGEKTFVSRFIGEENQRLYPQAMDLYLEYYFQHCGDQTRLYPGVKETLEAFSDKHLAVLSNKMERFTRRQLEVLGIAHLFAAIKGGDSYHTLKPSSQGLAALIQELGRMPAETLMVGDKPADILAGKGAGAHTLAVTYGYGELEVLKAAAPDAIIPAFPCLRDLID